MKPIQLMLGALAALVVSGCTTTRDVALQGNKELVRRYFDAWVNRGDPAVADELIATNVVLRNPPAAVMKSLEEYKTRMFAFHAAFPDGRYAIEEQVAEGDRVVVRWTLRGTQSGEFQGRPATGKTFTVTGISIFRIAQGKIQEITVNMDRLGMMEQLGWLLPSIVWVPEMQSFGEDFPSKALPTADEIAAFQSQWRQLRDSIAARVSVDSLVSISRWAQEQTKKTVLLNGWMTNLPMNPIGAAKDGQRVLFSQAVEQGVPLPVHAPLVFRRLIVGAVYDREARSIAKVYITIRGWREE